MNARDTKQLHTRNEPRPPLDDGAALGLFTDLYELTMLQAYWREGMDQDAVFTLFSRRLPERRAYLLACGIRTVLDYLETLSFDEGDIDYLASLGQFSDDFLDWLRDFRFSGDVYAVAEGTPIFANEPILEVVAPLPQAQLVETLIMNQVHLQTTLASKAARVVAAARGRTVVDFGARRMHGLDAAVKAARAFHVAGVSATSNLLAGRRYGIPVTGTMAHSYIQAHDNEMEAFRAFADLYPETILLVDTYDTLDGVRKVVALAEVLGSEFRVEGVRLDSGDLGKLAGASRDILDAAGLADVSIFASGGLDEDEITALLDKGAPIDGFGIGTHMGVAADAPGLDMAYKLAEYAGKPRLKLSSGKPILPGRKQIFRTVRNGELAGDTIARADESLEGEPLIRQVMKAGSILRDQVASLGEAREHARRQIEMLPQDVRDPTAVRAEYAVAVSTALRRLQDEAKEAVAQG